MKMFRNQKKKSEDRMETNRSVNRKQYKTNMRNESETHCKRKMITKKFWKTSASKIYDHLEL